jgi:6-phosphogluconolactonase (cycloisomerase 2 family)
VYVTNNGSDDISGYTINTTTGALAPIAGSPFANIANPSAIAVSSNGFFAFVTNTGASNTVTAYRVATDGTFLRVPSTQTNPNPAPVGMDPVTVVISPDTQFLYVANRGSDTVTAFSIGNGAVLTRVPQTSNNPNPVSVHGSAPRSMAISPSGRFFYVANSGSNTVTTFEIGPNGLLTLVPPTATSSNPISVEGTTPKDIALVPNRPFLYVSNSSSHTVTAFHIEANGLLTLAPPTTGAPNPTSVGGITPNGVMASSNGQFLYTANGDGTVTAFTIGSGGLLKLISAAGGTPNPIPAGTNPVAMTRSPDGRFLFVANGGGTVSSYAMSTTTGLLTPLVALLGNPFRAGTSPSSIAAPGHP